MRRDPHAVACLGASTCAHLTDEGQALITIVRCATLYYMYMLEMHADVFGRTVKHRMQGTIVVTAKPSRGYFSSDFISVYMC